MCSSDLVGSQVGSVAALRREPTERCNEVVGAERRDLEQRLALGQVGDGSTGRARGGAALGIEADRLDAARVEHQGEPHQVTAGSAAGGA